MWLYIRNLRRQSETFLICLFIFPVGRRKVCSSLPKKKKADSTCHVRWGGAYFRKPGMAVSVRVLFWCSMAGPRHSAAHGSLYWRFSVIFEWQAECKPPRCINLIQIYRTCPWCMCQISKIRVILLRIHYFIWKRAAGTRQHKARCDIQPSPRRQTQHVEIVIAKKWMCVCWASACHISGVWPEEVIM